MAWSWHQWAELLTDSGFNYYTFWQLSLGKQLFRDLGYYHGPFSPYFCAVIFKIFGVSYEKLALVHGTITLSIAQLIFVFFSRCADKVTAFTTSLFFLIFFAFSQYTEVANYNYISPYKFEMVHGMFFVVFLLFAFSGYLEKKKNYFLLMAGICWGACLLTCSEMILASTGTAFAGLIFFVLSEKNREIRKKIALHFFTGSLIFPLGFFLYFLKTSSIKTALQYTFNAVFFPLQHPSLSKNSFFQHISGFDNIFTNTFFMLLASSALVLTIALFVLADKATLSKKLRVASAAVTLLIYILFVDPLWNRTLEFARVLPLIALGISLFIPAILMKLMEPKKKNILFGLWGIFSFLLIFKILLNSQVYHYGIFLAMPASLCLIAFLCFYFPTWLMERFHRGELLRFAVIALCAGLAFTSISVSSISYARRSFLVGRGQNAFLAADPQTASYGFFTAISANWLEQNTAADSTLLTLPEGTILNFLTHRARPGPYTMNPVEYLSLGENRILRAWQDQAPDYIALVGQNSSEFALPEFGTSPLYGAATMKWVNENYTALQAFGPPPFQKQGFGIQILKKK